MSTASGRLALRLIVLIGILSFFADFAYEGSRSIVGPYLASLDASGTIVGAVGGLGELLGYGLRLFSGRLADATGRYWPITPALVWPSAVLTPGPCEDTAHPTAQIATTIAVSAEPIRRESVIAAGLVG